jgi:hypothetical protein
VVYQGGYGGAGGIVGCRIDLLKILRTGKKQQSREGSHRYCFCVSHDHFFIG